MFHFFSSDLLLLLRKKMVVIPFPGEGKLIFQATPTGHNCMCSLVAPLSITDYPSQVREQVWLMLWSIPCYSLQVSLSGTCPTGEDIMQTPRDINSLPACSDQCEFNCSLVKLLSYSFQSGFWAFAKSMAESEPTGADTPHRHSLLAGKT